MLKNKIKILAGVVCALVLLATASASAQTLSLTNGLVLWLNADVGVTTNPDSTVTAWADQSGLANNAGPTSEAAFGVLPPLLVPNSYNGHATLRYNNNNCLDVANANGIDKLNGDTTLITVDIHDTFGGPLQGLLSKTTVGRSAPFDYWNNNLFFAGSWTPIFNEPPDGIWAVQTFSWGNSIVRITRDNVDAIIPGSGPFYNIGMTGAANGTEPLRIGERTDRLTFFAGNVAEILIYNRVLTSYELNVVHTYLDAKYGTTNALVTEPSVSFTTLTNGQTFATGASIPVSLTTSSTYPISTFAVYANGTPLATSSRSPYNLHINAVYPGPVNLTAVVQDSSGFLFSNTVALNVTGTVVTDLPQSNAVAIWLKADSGVSYTNDGVNLLVTNWADQSGNGNNAFQTNNPSLSPVLVAGALNGLPVLHFNNTNLQASSAYLEMSVGNLAFMSTNLTMLAVVAHTDNNIYRTIVSRTTGNNAAPVEWYVAPPPARGSPGSPTLDCGSTFLIPGSGAAIGSTDSGTLKFNPGNFHVLGVTVQGNGVPAATTLASHMLDLNFGTPVTSASPAMANNPTNNLQIGRRISNINPMKGDIAELLIYNQALSSTDASNAVSYLLGKYNIGCATYAPQPPVVSITSPAAGGNTSPSTINFTVSASSPESALTSVDFLANGFLLLTVPAPTNGSYTISIDLLNASPSVVFTAVGHDSWGNAGSSVPVTNVITGTSSLITPPAGALVWLQADQGISYTNNGVNLLVTNWTDLTNGIAAVQETNARSPYLVSNALNGHAVVNFPNLTGATSTSLHVPSTTALDFMTNETSVFVMGRIVDTTTFRCYLNKNTTGGAAGRNLDWYYFNSTSGNNLTLTERLYLGNTTGYYVPAVPVPSFVVNQYNVSSYTVKNTGPSGTNTTFSVTGYQGTTSLGSHTLTTFQSPNVTSGDLQIGRRNDNAVWLRGDIAEIMIYPTALNAGDVSLAQNYLLRKYGLSVVAVHNNPPVISGLIPTNGATVAVSDSINVQVQVVDPENNALTVQFLVNGAVFSTQTTAPFTLPLQAQTPGIMTLQVVASDGYNPPVSSAVVSITVTGSSSSVAPTNGLVLWLKSDTGVTTNVDGTVATWSDQSGNANDAAATGFGGVDVPSLVYDPAIGQNVVAFNGVGSMALASANLQPMDMSGDLSLFYIAEYANFAGTRSICSKSFANAARDFNYVVTSAAASLFRSGSIIPGPISSARPLPAAAYVDAGFTVTGLNVKHYLGGSLNGSGNLLGSGLPAFGALLIGGHDNGIGLDEQFVGNILEILIYTNGVSGAALTDLNNYLATKAGVAVPAVNPYPTLAVARTGNTTAQFSWWAGYTGYVLEGRTNLVSGSWLPISTNPPGNQISVNTTNAAQFFRLRAQ